MNIWDIIKSVGLAIAFLFLFHYSYNYWNSMQIEKKNSIEHKKGEKYKSILQEIENKLRSFPERSVEEHQVAEACEGNLQEFGGERYCANTTLYSIQEQQEEDKYNNHVAPQDPEAASSSPERPEQPEQTPLDSGLLDIC
jgi:hypothetical protein